MKQCICGYIYSDNESTTDKIYNDEIGVLITTEVCPKCFSKDFLLI